CPGDRRSVQDAARPPAYRRGDAPPEWCRPGRGTLEAMAGDSRAVHVWVRCPGTVGAAVIGTLAPAPSETVRPPGAGHGRAGRHQERAGGVTLPRADPCRILGTAPIGEAVGSSVRG